MKDKKLIPVIAGAAAAVVVIIIAIVALANPAKSVMSKYNKAYVEREAEDIYALMPQIEQDYRNDDLDKDDKLEEDDFVKEIKEALSDDFEDYEKDYNKKVKVIRARKVKKDIIEQYNEYLDKYSKYKDVYDKSVHEVTAAYIVDIQYTITNDEKTYSSVSGDIIIVKENGKWKKLSGETWSDSSYYFDWENENDFKELEDAIEEYGDYDYYY